MRNVGNRTSMEDIHSIQPAQGWTGWANSLGYISMTREKIYDNGTETPGGRKEGRCRPA